MRWAASPMNENQPYLEQVSIGRSADSSKTKPVQETVSLLSLLMYVSKRLSIHNIETNAIEPDEAEVRYLRNSNKCQLQIKQEETQYRNVFQNIKKSTSDNCFFPPPGLE